MISHQSGIDRSVPSWSFRKNRVAFDFPPRGAPADAKKFEIVPGVVGICPQHKANIVETETHYTTEDSSTQCKIHISPGDVEAGHLSGGG